MVVRISDKTQNYSKVTKLLVKPFIFKKDINVFFSRLQEQSDVVASWSDSTIQKLKQVLLKMFVDTEYLDNTKSERLNTVLIDFDLKIY